MRAAAQVAGVPWSALRRLSELGVKKEERDGQIMWTRTEEAYE
jgi:hypothetical protein